MLVHWASTLMSPSVPILLKNSPTTWGCCQLTLLLGHYSAGDEHSWFPLNMMLRIEVRPQNQTTESCFSKSKGLLGAVLQIPSVFSCFIFTEERIEFGHNSIKHRLVKCCSYVCPSVGFSHLHIWPWGSNIVTISILVNCPNKALFYQLVSLARRPALGRFLIVLNFYY